MSTEQVKKAAVQYAERIEKDLRENILPFWTRESVNPDGSFYGEVSKDLRVNPDAERGSLLTSRILWTFSSACAAYSDPQYRSVADYAYADLMRLYADTEHGGFIWAVHPDGAPSRERKQVYGQAFAIYALTAYAEATGRKAILEQAIELFRLIEAKCKDPVHGGYFEAYARDWSPIADVRLSVLDQNAPKSQNTLLHVMEAYTALLAAWPDPQLKKAHHELVELMLDKVVDRDHPHLGLFFKEDWQCWNPGDISFGHDIEAAWLLDEAAQVQGDPVLSSRVRDIALKIADSVLSEGVDSDGAMLYEGKVGRGVTNTNKDWWPQVEAIMGLITVYGMSGNESYLKAAFRMWDFCESHLIDREHGGWFHSTNRAGQVTDEPKISFWTCPYHNGRCGLLAPGRLRAIGG